MKKTKTQDEITLSLRRMIWQAVCEDGVKEDQVVGYSIFNTPRWRDYASQLSRLAGEPDDDYSLLQGVVTWENWRRVFRNEPELVEHVRRALAAPSRRLTVCCVSLCRDTFEITYLDPLQPDMLN